MSPRRKFAPGEGSLFVTDRAERRRLWELPLVNAVAAVLMVAAITVSTLMLVSHEKRESRASKDRQVLNYVTWFMAQFTTIDPYHANEYVARVLAQSTGEFAKECHEKANEILLQVARAEPATGTVIDAGVERWNEDGSVSILVATDVTSKSPDERQVFDNTNRWTATATQEGKQWKISSLLQVI
jgi:Mce-associated membrane protein